MVLRHGPDTAQQAPQQFRTFSILSMKKKIAFIHTKHYSMQLFLFHGDVLLEWTTQPNDFSEFDT